MKQGARVRNIIDLALRISRYNLKIIFANKFIYFLLASFLFFLLVTVIIFFNPDSDPHADTIYNTLLFPGILLVFYPMAFGIQNDVDSRMIEILFGIPNYRYKVWIVRMVLIWLIVFFILCLLTVLSAVSLVNVPILQMVYQLMFPIFFLGSLCFMFSTVVRSGNGSAVIMVIIGMGFWIAGGILAQNRWNIFLNPFITPDNQAAWAGIVFKNRIFLTAGIVLALLYGLFNLQKREKFI
ncbi:MAG: hypothetical protein JXB45_03315 [Candidatus Krumholzibacteriota bacterium]|nr:hypothetical protein [Candidatus Krumholzibacteriota bacterium]